MCCRTSPVVEVRLSAEVADAEVHLSFLRIRTLPSPAACENLRTGAAASHLRLP
jgi:hypothetical protein